MADPNNNPSTVKSYIDSATGAAQSALGSLTGNTGDKAQGQIRKEEAKDEHEASKATVKVPGAAVSSSGAAAEDHPDRSQGNWNQTTGSAKEALGGLIGNESLKTSGRQQNLEGQQQEAKGQLKDFGGGLANRVQGAVGGAVSNLTGDSEAEARHNQMRAEGKTQQRSAEHDMQKQAEAEGYGK